MPTIGNTRALTISGGEARREILPPYMVGREHCAAGRRLYDPERHRSHRFLFGGHDPGVCACNMSGQAEWALGYPDEALASSAEGLALAEGIAHPFSLELALV